MSTERSEEELPEELKAIETALRGLKPAVGSIDRDRLMYLAGRASVAPPAANGFRYAWPLATAAMLLVSLSLGGRLLYLSGMGERMTVVERAGGDEGLPIAVDSATGRPVAPSLAGFRAMPGGEFNYMQLRNTVLSHGVDALPAAPVRNAGSIPTMHAPHFPTLRDNFWGS